MKRMARLQGVERLWLVCYDIADPRRLRRVHRYLSRHALPCQYSVFILAASEEQAEAHCDALARLIEERVDDVRMYCIPQRVEFWPLGLQGGLQGVTLAGSLTALLGQGEVADHATETVGVDDAEIFAEG